MNKIPYFYLPLLVLLSSLFISCGQKKDGDGSASCEAPINSYPQGVSSAPTMTFYFGSATDTTGTALTSGNSTTFGNYFQSGGCGPFGIWESGGGGEVATEIEMRQNTRLGVFAMADGVVVEIQSSTSPLEAGEVEGVWVRYGTQYVIKYVHVKDPIVNVGDIITAGQRIGSTVHVSGGTYFWEAELRYRNGSTIYSKAWNSLLTNASAFNALYGATFASGSCTPGGALVGTDGTTATTAANWVNTEISSGEWNVTNQNRACSFP